MNLYDLRYSKQSKKSYTTPFVEFPEYRNESTPGYLAGFDAHKDLNVIAAACDRDAKREIVTLFDAGSGKRLAKGDPMVGKIEYPSWQKSSCVRFVEDKYSLPVVMVASDLGMEDWV